jgi:hypothetical protein
MRWTEFFRRSKVSKVEKALFATFDLLKNLYATSLIMRSKVFKALFRLSLSLMVC